tara:strand:- start:44 stop:736 length:693 start_codon:yes stop_codon:yes gene_type:complete
MVNKILITGTSSGLGKKLANHYLKKKFAVIGISRTKQKLKKKNYFHYAFDISKKPELIKNMKKIFIEHKNIDYLINNVATNNSFGIFSFISEKSILTDIQTNILANLYLTKIVSNHMIRQKFGRIVNIGSVSTKLLLKGDAIYASCKSFVDTFTKILSKELVWHGVTCNVISISLFDGRLNKKISSKTLSMIRKKYKREKFVNIQEITNILDKKIFIKSIKNNSKTYNIF